MNPKLPPATETEDGAIRRVGVELEFAELELADVANAIQAEYGGKVVELNAYEFDVEDTTFGTFRVELDAMFLKELGRREKGESPLLAQLEQFGEELLAGATKPLVPREICSPPMPIDQITTLNTLLTALRKLGAEGTHESLIYAFGVHLNPELPDTKPETIVAYMQAFAVLYEWLKKQQRVDIKRRISPFIQPWTKDYVLKLCGPDYDPSQSQMIDDYLKENASRNRALDMLPLFANLDEKWIRSRLPEEKIKPRPTFHYRLPNCEIDRADWGIDDPWKYWLYVEELAYDHERRREICAAYVKYLKAPLTSLGSDWTKLITKWL